MQIALLTASYTHVICSTRKEGNVEASLPNAVLWGSDMKSKRLVSVVAEKMNLGLCADCTQLECEDGTLVMYRPALYDMQVGLTGKTVCPPVYIVIGISGAVHHIVGMQCAGTVIAINPDKNAHIFEYADYGIISDF